MNSNSLKDIFVSPDYTGSSNGSVDAPFKSVADALEHVSPGYRIILKSGTYGESVSIQNSGTLTDPIRIEADKSSEVEITASWFIYDSSDIIISGINFKNIKSQALSIIGACERNSLNNLTFNDCGTDSKTPCTLFIGGSGSNCNVIEKCTFKNSSNSDKSIAIILSEGNTDENAEPNKNIIIRENIFDGFDTALILGTREEVEGDGLYGHVIEGNLIKNCKSDALRLRCGDTIIKDNLIKNCERYGILIHSGVEQTISFNRFSECGTAINIESDDILIRQNMFINSINYDIELPKRENAPKGSVAINHNSFFVKEDSESLSVKLSEDRPLIMRKNLILNSDNLINSKVIGKQSFLEKNYTILEKSNNEYCTTINSTSSNFEEGNYSTDTNFGASGWQVEGEDVPKSEIIRVKSLQDSNDKVEELINEVDSRELYSRSFFMNQEDNHDEDPPEDAENGEITDYSTWD